MRTQKSESLRASLPESPSRRAVLRVAALMLLTFLALLLAAGCGGGGGGGGGGQQNNDATAIGVVIDAANADNPVSGATVAIGTATAITANDGSFTITNPTQGATAAVVTANGLAAQTIALETPITTGTNNVGNLVINIGQVRGTVLQPDGSFAANAFVSIAANGDTTQTGSDGTFLLVNVPLGTTRLTIASDTATLTQDITVGNGVTDLGQLRLVTDPNAGNPPAFPRTLTGTVVLGGGGGGAVSGTNVLLFRNGQQVEATVTGSDGTFFFYVPVGTYTLQFRRVAFQDASAGPFTITNPSQPLDVGTFTLELNP